MAEMAVSFAIDQLLPLLREETNLLKGIHKEFAVIKDEFESIQAFLKDAEKIAAAEGDNRDEGINTWVKQVTEAAFRLEDIIDEYMVHMRQQPQDPGCVAILNKIAHLVKTMMPRHRIASEIQDIKSTIFEINERSKRYRLQIQPSFEQGSSNSEGRKNVTWHDPRMSSLYIEDAELVGFEAPRDKLIGWLVEGSEDRTVISVVGMGGQGKTTLANKVFKDRKVVEYFDCHAWITVSQSYTVEGLLRDMLNKFCKEKGENLPESISQMNRDLLIEELRTYLQQKRYIVVFDDVWNVQFWDEIDFAVYDNKRGSKIIITTRNKDVGISCMKSSFVHVHDLQPLTEEKSLELFYRKAFRFNFNGCCPNDLKDISFEIVKRCQGLPLAIVVIGGLLSCKGKTASEWGRFNRSLSSELEKDSRLSSITRILGFSYDDLPYYLKSCLLYFGMYPEDYDIRSKRLIFQWIAEGFVKYERGKTLEEVAEEYITELVARNLVQLSSVNFEGKVKVCRVHDLTREMILKKCKNLSFCQYISGEDEAELSGISRRQSIATNYDNFKESTKSSHVRSLFLFQDGELREDHVKRILKKYKLLKVLDFEGAKGLQHFPNNLGNLIHLKYLSFKGTQLSNLPKSIGELQSLENLNLMDTKIRILPKEICKLKKLRHLEGYMYLNEVKEGIGGMTSLQTLKNVEISDEADGIEVITQLTKLKRQLRNLGLIAIKITSEHGTAVCSLLNEMQHLEKLLISTYAPTEVVFDLNSIASPPKHVRKLHLEGELNKKLPRWVKDLHNLVKLILTHTKLIEDPGKSLQNLPNLLHLYVGNEAYEGECMHFEEGGFQNLKELYLGSLDNVKSIKIDKGAMSSLIKFTLCALHELKRLPPGIQYLNKLQFLNIWCSEREFKERISANGEDHWIIQHVPRVDIG